MFVQPSLATRLDATFPSLTPDEIGVMREIAAAFADEPGEFSLCLAEQLELAEQRIILEALHGRPLSFGELARYHATHP
ncbi:MAG: hypothetical protein Q8L39_16515 [Burkholderiales bacterium]|nr:hypothetical protein [Burkholderiales bacterium]